MFDKTPTTWIPSWGSDGTDLTIPIASFPELSAAEAHPATGDIRKIAHALAEKLFQAYNSRPAADRPAKMVISKNSSVNDETGDVSRIYSFRFTLLETGAEVKDE